MGEVKEESKKWKKKGGFKRKKEKERKRRELLLLVSLARTRRGSYSWRGRGDTRGQANN